MGHQKRELFGQDRPWVKLLVIPTQLECTSLQNFRILKTDELLYFTYETIVSNKVWVIRALMCCSFHEP